MSKARLQKIGNSTGVILRKDLLSEAGMKAGDAVEISVQPDRSLKLAKSDDLLNRGREIIQQTRKRYPKTLSDLAK